MKGRMLARTGLMLALWATAAFAQETLPGANLQSLLLYAREHNPELAAMRLEAQAAQERIEPAGALADPRLRLTLQDITKGGTQSPTVLPGRTGATGYQVMQDVPWFGKRDLRRDIARFDAHSAQGKAQASWTELASKIKVVHAQIYTVSRNLRLTRENQDLMTRLEKVALARYAGGLAPQQDVIRAQVEQGNLAAEQVAMEMEQHHLHTRLNALLSRPPTAALTEPDALRALPTPAQLNWDELLRQLHERNPQLYAETAKLQSARKSSELVKKNNFPDVTFGVTPMQMGSAIRQWELMFEMNIPLQQGSRAAQAREAQAMLDAAWQRQAATQNQVENELAQALAALDAAQRTEALALHRLLPQAELTYQSALTGYETGKVDFATLLDAQRQIRTAQAAQLKALVEAHVQMAEIERLLGEE